MKFAFAVLWLLIRSAYCKAQEIRGIVTDSAREPVINVAVVALQGNSIKGSGYTDLDGQYVIKPLEPGYYQVSVAYDHHKTLTFQKVIVAPGEITKLNLRLNAAHGYDTSELITYKKPLIYPYRQTSSVPPGNEGALKSYPPTTVTDSVAVTPNIYKHGCGGGPVDPPAPRANDTTRNVYIIDGVVVYGAPHGSTGCCTGGAVPEFRKISFRKWRYKHRCKRALREYQTNLRKSKTVTQ
jgi:hypothetical protein